MTVASALSLAIAASLAFSPSAHAQKDEVGCKPVFDAMLKAYTVPAHSLGTRLASGSGAKPFVMESIRTASATYVKLDGKWKEVPMTQASAMAQEKENIKNAMSYSCRAVRQESINGIAATVYDVTIESEDDKSAGTILVARESGLVLRQETDSGLDEPDAKTHMTLTYDYSNVQAPPGVH